APRTVRLRRSAAADGGRLIVPGREQPEFARSSSRVRRPPFPVSTDGASLARCRVRLDNPRATTLAAVRDGIAVTVTNGPARFRIESPPVRINRDSTGNLQIKARFLKAPDFAGYAVFVIEQLGESDSGDYPLVVREIQERVRTVRTAVADRPRPRVLYLIWTDPLIAAGAASYINDLLGLAGGQNVVKERTVPYPRLDWEQVIGRAPQIILVADHRADAGRTASAAAVTPREWRGWQAVPAIRSGRVVPIPGDTVLRPGPRVGEGLARLAQAIHREPGERQGSR
ncbi:MAG: helical backbone metal receptor, partial [candidate division NC10 bacterium]